MSNLLLRHKKSIRSAACLVLAGMFSACSAVHSSSTPASSVFTSSTTASQEVSAEASEEKVIYLQVTSRDGQTVCGTSGTWTGDVADKGMGQGFGGNASGFQTLGGTGDGTASGTMPQTPPDGTASGTMPQTPPDGMASGTMPQMPQEDGKEFMGNFTAGDETVTLTLPDRVSIQKEMGPELTDAALDEIAVDSILKVTYAADGSIQSVQILMTRAEKQQDGMGGRTDQKQDGTSSVSASS